MIFPLRALPGLLRQTFKEWSRDKVPRLGAALSFYTAFSIAPLFIIAIAIAGFAVGETDQARSQIFEQVSALVGQEGAKAIESMVHRQEQTRSGWWGALIAGATLLLGATGVFVQLQDALNSIWGVPPARKRGGVLLFLRKRLLSFAMVLTIGFLLLVSLILSAALSALSKFTAGFVPGMDLVWQAVNVLASLGLITVLFAMLFKFLPDLKIGWRDVWTGAFITAALFTAGKFLIGLYLGNSKVAVQFGAAGSLVVLLLWVYYSSQLFFFGAEFTQVFSRIYGTRPPLGDPDDIRIQRLVHQNEQLRRRLSLIVGKERS